MPLRPLPTAACLLVALLSAPAAGAANPPARFSTR